MIDEKLKEFLVRAVRVSLKELGLDSDPLKDELFLKKIGSHMESEENRKVLKDIIEEARVELRTEKEKAMEEAKIIKGGVIRR
jgi:formylmethanofuran dehydrogenase subunit E